MPCYHARITGKNVDALADLVRKYKVTVARHTVKRLKNGSASVDAHVESAQIRRLKAAGYAVKELANADAEGKQRQAQFRKSAGARKAAAAPGRRALRAAQGYLDVDEVEAALQSISSAPNTAFTRLIVLPHRTWEKRTCRALKIGRGSGRKPAIFLLGGVHAREWGSPDILVNFARTLTQAYADNTGVTLGTNRFSAATLRKIVEDKEIYILPQLNPDGRFHSMTKASMWRKNRRPAPAGHSQSRCVGVDLNRNFDFLWNYPRFFSPDAPIANSTNPCDSDVYIGPRAMSEPETRNAVWMFDQYPNIRHFIDVHSYSESILYSWGDDRNQTATPQMNFRNPAFDGKRGIVDDKAYAEYIPPVDKAQAVKLANHMRSAIERVRGHVYKVQQAIELYPTAGTSDDYAFSRHIIDGRKAKITSFTIEWGSERNATPFHPEYTEMQKIIQEITAALFAFCAKAA
jgi:murein tripeptide amidase MpaA